MKELRNNPLLKTIHDFKYNNEFVTMAVNNNSDETFFYTNDRIIMVIGAYFKHDGSMKRNCYVFESGSDAPVVAARVAQYRFDSIDIELANGRVKYISCNNRGTKTSMKVFKTIMKIGEHDAD